MGYADFEVILMHDHTHKKTLRREEKPISNIYPVIDNDLARDNIENHIPDADLEDL